MGKKPPNTPEVGDIVRLRGKPESEGVLRELSPLNNWGRVEWTKGKGPKICHLFEMEKAPTVQ